MQDNDKIEDLRRKREELKKSLLGEKFVPQKIDSPIEENPERDSHTQSISDEPMDELLRKKREQLRMKGLMSNKKIRISSDDGDYSKDSESGQIVLTIPKGGMLRIKSDDSDNNITDSEFEQITPVPEGKIDCLSYWYSSHSSLHTKENFIINESVKKIYDDNSLLNLFHNVKLPKQQADEAFSKINQEEEEVLFNEVLYLEEKRKELRRKLLLGEKIPIFDSTTNAHKYKIYAINRHRVLRDGSGITTLVGLGGCDLNCKYCINPMSRSPYSTEYKQYTCRQLLNEIRSDKLYFLATGGGVTFGGGEPLLSADCIVEFAEICNRRWKINVETSFNVPMTAVEAVIRVVDEMVVDIKDMNPIIYQEYTGSSNQNVINNLKFAFHAGYADKVKIRVPLIPGYNTKTDVEHSIEVLKEMGYTKIERLTYTTNISSGKDVDADGVYGKRICETLRTIRKAIVDSTNIDYQLLSCNHSRCVSGSCPACDKELSDIEDLIIEKRLKL